MPPAVVLTAIGVCLSFLTTSPVHAASRPTSLQTQVARVATIDLSQSDKYSEIAVVNDRIVLYGSTSSSNDPVCTVQRQATMLAYLDDFRLLCISILAMVPLVFLMKKSKPGGGI
ncbi:MAG: hypothetical protein ACLQRM_03565, partial [Acidimicrobiales bacterium]